MNPVPVLCKQGVVRSSPSVSTRFTRGVVGCPCLGASVVRSLCAVGCMRLPRFGGQVDYAAWAAGWWWILASYSTGVR